MEGLLTQLTGQNSSLEWKTCHEMFGQDLEQDVQASRGIWQYLQTLENHLDL